MCLFRRQILREEQTRNLIDNYIYTIVKEQSNFKYSRHSSLEMIQMMQNLELKAN